MCVTITSYCSVEKTRPLLKEHYRQHYSRRKHQKSAQQRFVYKHRHLVTVAFSSELMISFSSQFLFSFFLFNGTTVRCKCCTQTDRETEGQTDRHTHRHSHARTHVRTHAHAHTHTRTHAHRHQPRVFVVLLRFEELILNFPFVLRLSH